MLVLSRRKDEKILLQLEGTNEEVELTVVKIDSNKVRLGFKAGKNVTILRSELIKPITKTKI